MDEILGTHNVIEFLDAHTAELSPLQRALTLQAAEDAKSAAIERSEQTEREAQGRDRVEALRFANRQGGDVLGGLQLARAAFEAADDRCRDLTAQLEKATVKRDRALSSIQDLSRRMDEMTAAVSRSAPVDMLALAKEALREAQAKRRVDAMLARSRSGARARPFVSRGDPAARSEYCVHCIDQGVDDETSYLLHSDPELNVPVTSPATQAAQAEADRLRALGFSAESARLAAVPYGAGLAVR